MNWHRVSIDLPTGANFEIGLLAFSLVMLAINVGLIVAMRYERRVR